MLSALLLMSLLGSPQTTPIAAQLPTHAGAAALARDGRYDEALDAYRRIAAANPRDHEARLWIARLHGWMGDPELAEPVYRSVMLEDPSNVEATIGVGRSLIALGRTDEGITMLERAEAAQPQNSEVLAELGRAHLRAGHTSRAVLYAERSVTIEAAEAHRQILEQARMRHGHHVDIMSFGEHYNTSTANTGSVDVQANFRTRDRFRVLGRGQHQRKFGFSEQRGGGGLEWQWRQRTSLFGHVLVGPTDNVVLPRVDVNTEIAHAAPALQWVAGYRYFDFPSADVSVVSPGLTWWPSERASIGARYFLSLTDLPTRSAVRHDHSVAVRASYQTIPRLWIDAGYAHGTEDFDTLSPDRIVDFRANTVSGGVRIDLPSLTSVIGGYEHQWRRNSIQMGRLTVSLRQRF